MTTITPPTRPCVMNVFDAVEHPARRRRATRRRAHAGGVAARRRPRSAPTRRASRRAPAATRYRCFCASVPNIADVRRAQAVVRGHRQRDRRIDARQLLDADAVVDRRHRRRRRTPRGTGCPSARAPPSFGSSSIGKCCASSHSLTCGRISALGELADGAAQQLLLVGQTEVHGRNVSREPGYGKPGSSQAAPTYNSLSRFRSAEDHAQPMALSCRVCRDPAIVLCVPAPASPTSPRSSARTRRPSNRDGQGLRRRHRPADRRLRVRVREHVATTSTERRAALRTVMGNGLLQTPVPIARHAVLRHDRRRRLSRSRSTTASETNFGINIGGGVKMTLVGPAAAAGRLPGLHAAGTPLHSKPHRFYAGLNLKF